MQKTLYLILLFLIITLIWFYNYSRANSSVNIYATVWEVNNAPRIDSIIPDINPTIVYLWQSLIFKVNISDIEWDNLFYTISTDDWSLDTTSWTLNWWWNITFLYQWPNYYPNVWTANEWLTKIYVTVTDSVNYIVKEINVYIF